jgi:hypothetical protein
VSNCCIYVNHKISQKKKILKLFVMCACERSVPFQVRNRVPPNLFNFMNAAIREEVWVPSQECGKYTSVISK